MNSQKVEHLWAHLHWLSILAQQGSFTAAAKRLGVSKAAMSQRLAELERVAGVALVQRTTRSVRLTETGQRLVDDTQDAFAQIAQTFAEVSDQAAHLRGLVRLTAPVALARQQLVPKLADFLHQYPEIRIELDMSDRLSSLGTEGFDLAIRHTATPPDTHVALRLCSTRSLLVASKAYLKRHGAPLAPADLKRHNCLHYPRPQETPAWTLQRVRGTEKVTIQVAGSFAANNSEALRDAALSGLGIALLPDFSSQAALQAGSLEVVLPNWRLVGGFAEQLYAIRPYSAHVPRAVTALVGYLRTAFAEGFGAEV